MRGVPAGMTKPAKKSSKPAKAEPAVEPVAPEVDLPPVPEAPEPVEPVEVEAAPVAEAPAELAVEINDKPVDWVASAIVTRRSITLIAKPGHEKDADASTNAVSVTVDGRRSENLACASFTAARGKHPAKVTIITRDRLCD